MKWLKNVIFAAVLALSLLVSGHSNAQPVVELTGKNTVLLDCEITPSCVHGFMQSAAGQRMMLPASQILYVIINSPGGDSTGSAMLRKIVDSLPNSQVICSECDSGAGLIFATTKRPRLVTTSSIMMMHEMSYEKVTAAMLTPEFIDDFKRCSDAFNKELYSVIGISKEQYEKNIIGQEWEVIGVANIKLHIADRVITPHCDRYLMGLLPNFCSH